MALLVAEGFDDTSNNGTSTHMLNKLYAFSGAYISTFQNAGGVYSPGRLGHGLSKGLTNSNSDIGWTLPENFQKLFFACALRRSASFSSVTPRIQFRYGTTTHVEICFGGADGSDLVVRVGGNPVGTPVSGFFTLGNFLWISVEVEISPTNGVVKIRNGAGVEIFAYTGNTYNSSAGVEAVNIVYLPTGGSSSNNSRIDDVFIMSPAGNSFNGHLTDTSIRPGYPTSNGAHTANWSPYGATNLWDTVDEAMHDADTTYAGTSTSGARLSMKPYVPTGAGANCMAVLVTSHCRKDDAAAWTWRNFVRFGGNDYDDSDAAASAGTAYKGRVSLWELNPANGQTWNDSDFATLECGILPVTE